MPLMRKKPVRRNALGRNAGAPRAPLLAPGKPPQPRVLPRRKPMEKAVKEVGQKPGWALSGWSQVPVIGSLFDFMRNLFFSRERFRVSKRAFVGTGLSKASRERMLQVRMSALRKGTLSRAERVKIMKNRTPGLKGTIASQHGRGKIRGVPKYPSEKAA